MKNTETRVTVIYDKDAWKLIQMIASKLMCYRGNGKVTPCTGSDIVRELLEVWLDEQSEEWFPKLLEEFRRLDVQSRARQILEQWNEEDTEK